MQSGWRDVGSSMHRLKENKQRRDVTEKVMSRGRERWRQREVISGDLQPRRCIEVCNADRSVMDFGMC